MVTDELINYVLGSKTHRLARTMADWLNGSRPFTTFVSANRDKIRKKVRTTADSESLLDLRLELETAYLLLQEKKLSLVYEPIQPKRSRSPDFAVTYTTSVTFLVEVTRQRAAVEVEAETADSPTTPQVDERLADTICSKLGQLLPQQSNILVVGVESGPMTSDDLRATMARLQQRAEQADDTFLRRYRLRDRADFFRHYQRLSEVLVRGSQVSATEPTAVWVNPQAKHALPSKVRTALYHSHAV
jgi:hypothetical protein